jgi:hypothetical protein
MKPEEYAETTSLLKQDPAKGGRKHGNKFLVLTATATVFSED